MRTTYKADSATGEPWMESNSDPQAQRLLERVVESSNMKTAWKQVKRNGGGKGMDGRSIAATAESLRTREHHRAARSPRFCPTFCLTTSTAPKARAAAPGSNGAKRNGNELERRAHSFCRYADDCNIYVASERAGKRVMQSVTEFVEQRLKLKVNREKSAVARPWTRKFLGFSVQKVFGKIRTSEPEVTLKRFRVRMKELFHIGRGRPMARFINETLNPVIRGWYQYFHLGASRGQIQTLDYWICRHLRCIIWRQWKRPSTRVKKLRSLGISHDNACVAYNRRRPWRNAGLSQLKQALSPGYFRKKGLFSLIEAFDRMRITST